MIYPRAHTTVGMRAAARGIRAACLAVGFLASPVAAEEAATKAPLASPEAASAVPVSPEAPLPARPAAAQYRPQGRELGGHVFMPVMGMVGPFATTSFGTFNRGTVAQQATAPRAPSGQRHHVS
jgi:hypothetical protein